MKNVNDCDICIADDGQYKLFTNKEGTLFTAGCHKRISRDEAITHWCKRSWSGENEQGRHLNDLEIKRARLFHKAITDYIEKIEGENMNKMDKVLGVLKMPAPTTLEEVQAQRKELDRIEAELKRKPWKPVDGHFVYHLMSNGEMERFEFDSSVIYHKELLAMGCLYKTRAQAEKAGDKRLAEVRLRNLIQECGGEQSFKPGGKNGYLFFDCDNQRVRVGSTTWIHQQGSIYFNPDIADELIKRIPEQDIKLLFDLEV